jgi:hypothetical protein
MDATGDLGRAIARELWSQVERMVKKRSGPAALARSMRSMSARERACREG